MQATWTGGTQRRQLPQQTESTQQGSRPFFLIERFHNTTKQRSSPQHSPYNKTSNVIGNRSRIGVIIHHGPEGSIYHNHFGRNGTQTSPHATTNRQFNGRSGRQWQDTTKTNKVHGYALPLVERQRVPGSIQNILETRKIQLCRLLEKASSFETPSEHSEGISHTTHCIRNFENRTTKYSNKSIPDISVQNRSTYEGVMIWSVNRYVHRYRLTARPLASTHLWAAPWIRMRRASHYSIIKIIRQLDNSKSPPWL